jgi:hypothetical protein
LSRVKDTTLAFSAGSSSKKRFRFGPDYSGGDYILGISKISLTN